MKNIEELIDSVETNETNKKLADITGNETQNTKTKDKFGNSITVPAGFKVVNPNDDVSKGIIIEDVSAEGVTENTEGSQFVWVPVGDIYTDSDRTEENKKTISLGRYDFDSSGNLSIYSGSNTEDTKDSHKQEYENDIAKNIDDFIKKVNLSHGYYIGRYEAGDATATNSKRTGINNSSDRSAPITCKEEVYPYIYVDQVDASSLCKEMYKSSDFESDLINSYAWDTAIMYIQECSEDKNYSRQIGINSESLLQKGGDSILTSVDLGDNTKDIRCNICDMAGNAYEWTTETSIETDVYGEKNLSCVYRGGNFYENNRYTSRRFSNDSNYCHDYLSFRPILYL